MVGDSVHVAGPVYEERKDEESDDKKAYWPAKN
jgi:hypothetical protein